MNRADIPLHRGPLCAQCGFPMRLDHFSPGLRKEARSDAVFRCTDCGLREHLHVQTD